MVKKKSIEFWVIDCNVLYLFVFGYYRRNFVNSEYLIDLRL